MGLFGFQLICERLYLGHTADIKIAAADDYSTMPGIDLIIV